MILLFTEIEVNVFWVPCMYVEIEINLEKFSDLIIHRKRSECIPSPLYVYRKWNQISKNSVILLNTEIEVNEFRVPCMYVEIEINLGKFNDLIIRRNRSECILIALYGYRNWNYLKKFSDLIIHWNRSECILSPLNPISHGGGAQCARPFLECIFQQNF